MRENCKIPATIYAAGVCRRHVPDYCNAFANSLFVSRPTALPSLALSARNDDESLISCVLTWRLTRHLAPLSLQLWAPVYPLSPMTSSWPLLHLNPPCGPAVPSHPPPGGAASTAAQGTALLRAHEPPERRLLPGGAGRGVRGAGNGLALPKAATGARGRKGEGRSHSRARQRMERRAGAHVWMGVCLLSGPGSRGP